MTYWNKSKSWDAIKYLIYQYNEYINMIFFHADFFHLNTNPFWIWNPSMFLARQLCCARATWHPPYSAASYCLAVAELCSLHQTRTSCFYRWNVISTKTTQPSHMIAETLDWLFGSNVMHALINSFYSSSPTASVFFLLFLGILPKLLKSWVYLSIPGSLLFQVHVKRLEELHICLDVEVLLILVNTTSWFPHYMFLQRYHLYSIPFYVLVAEFL